MKIDEKSCKEEIIQIMTEGDDHSIEEDLFHIYVCYVSRTKCLLSVNMNKPV